MLSISKQTNKYVLYITCYIKKLHWNGTRNWNFYLVTGTGPSIVYDQYNTWLIVCDARRQGIRKPSHHPSLCRIFRSYTVLGALIKFGNYFTKYPRMTNIHIKIFFLSSNTACHWHIMVMRSLTTGCGVFVANLECVYYAFFNISYMAYVMMQGMILGSPNRLENFMGLKGYSKTDDIIALDINKLNMSIHSLPRISPRDKLC